MFCLHRSFISLGTILAYSAFAGAGLGQENNSPQYARDAFWSAWDLAHPEPSPDAKRMQKKSVPPPPLALRYSILRRGTDGRYEEVSSNTTFQKGDAIRLKVTSTKDGYLYVIERGSSGAWLPLFPAAGTTGTNRLMQFHDITVPAEEKQAWKFTGQPGQEKVFILLNRTPQINLDETIASLQSSGGANASIGDQLVARLRDQVNGRDLVLTNADDVPDPSTGRPVDPSTGKADHAAYVANTKESIVRADVVLSFR